jgi:hypothetical protein
MRPFAALLVALAALAAAPVLAQAKEISKVEVCGPSACVPVDKSHHDDFMDGGLAAEPPGQAQAWYSIRYTISPAPGEKMEKFTFHNAYVPGANRIRERAEGGGVAWFEPSDAFVRAVRTVLDDVKPFPAAKLTGLESGLPDVRVDEVVAPPTEQPAAAGDSAPWPWIGGAAAVLLAALLLALGLRFRPGGAARVAP